MNDRIENELARIESDHQVRILYACESGSRAWGFPSADSDWDVRFIYVRPAREYLRFTPPRDVIELPIDDALDLSGWDLYKACGLLRKMNPPLLEWLGSPIVYRDDGVLATRFRDLAATHFNLRACCEHYLSMAKGNYETSIRGRATVRQKKYLYALRPLMCLRWLLERRTMAPTDFFETLAGLELDAGLRDAIDELVASKRDESEAKEVAPIAVFESYILEQLESLPSVLKDISGSGMPRDTLDEVIHEVLEI